MEADVNPHFADPAVPNGPLQVSPVRRLHMWSTLSLLARGYPCTTVLLRHSITWHQLEAPMFPWGFSIAGACAVVLPTLGGLLWLRSGGCASVTDEMITLGALFQVFTWLVAVVLANAILGAWILAEAHVANRILGCQIETSPAAQRVLYFSAAPQVLLMLGWGLLLMCEQIGYQYGVKVPPTHAFSWLIVLGAVWRLAVVCRAFFREMGQSVLFAGLSVYGCIDCWFSLWWVLG